MIQQLDMYIPELESMKKYPSKISYIGNIDLLKRLKISIIGTRKPNQYTRHLTYQLAKKLADVDVCVVSGVAMGVDAISHTGAGASNTIAVVANGVDIRYPAVNKELLKSIENEGLVVSQVHGVELDLRGFLG
jgi:DNA processing protein